MLLESYVYSISLAVLAQLQAAHQLLVLRRMKEDPTTHHELFLNTLKVLPPPGASACTKVLMQLPQLVVMAPPLCLPACRSHADAK